MSNSKEKEIQDLLSRHRTRNSALQKLLLEKAVDLRSPRLIEFHFWAADSQAAEALSGSLQERGFTILIQREMNAPNAERVWNIEARLEQSVAMTVAPEITEELVRLAATHNSQYDGWGTSV